MCPNCLFIWNFSVGGIFWNSSFTKSPLCLFTNGRVLWTLSNLYLQMGTWRSKGVWGVCLLVTLLHMVTSSERGLQLEEERPSFSISTGEQRFDFQQIFSGNHNICEGFCPFFICSNCVTDSDLDSRILSSSGIQTSRFPCRWLPCSTFTLSVFRLRWWHSSSTSRSCRTSWEDRGRQ